MGRRKRGRWGVWGLWAKTPGARRWGWRQDLVLRGVGRRLCSDFVLAVRETRERARQVASCLRLLGHPEARARRIPDGTR